MTVRASQTTQLVVSPQVGAAAGTRELRTIVGVILGGSLNGDVIIASHEALSIVKAGMIVRALVIAGLERMARTVALGGGRMLRLEFGIYRTIG